MMLRGIFSSRGPSAATYSWGGTVYREVIYHPFWDITCEAWRASQSKTEGLGFLHLCGSCLPSWGFARNINASNGFPSTGEHVTLPIVKVDRSITNVQRGRSLGPQRQFLLKVVLSEALWEKYRWTWAVRMRGENICTPSFCSAGERARL